MSQNNLSNDSTATATRQATVGGSVTMEEKERILLALDQSGWAQSPGIRTIMLAFAECAAVRDAVFNHIRSKPIAA